MFPAEAQNSHAHWMQHAIELAKNGRFTAHPNPCVGCVIVKNDLIVASAWHHRTGEPHAEVNALLGADKQAKDANVYVSLEPCNHQGITGPCTQALIDAEVARVFYGMIDPNPLVAGQGIQRLQAAGIEVIGPVLESEARALNPGFIQRMQLGRPWVRCKLATSLDGRTAMSNGESHWITGPKSREDVQFWRARSSAILTGIGTVIADDCRLTLRREQLTMTQFPSELADEVLANPPLRVILDTHLKIAESANVLNNDAPTLVITSERATQQHANKLERMQTSSLNLSVECVGLTPQGRLDLEAVLQLLGRKYHCNDLLLEAGAQLSGALLQEGLIDELIVYQAPILLGSKGRPLFELPIDAMSNKITLTVQDKRDFGDDQRIIARPQLNQ